MVLGIASLRCLRGVSLEAFGGHRHQIGYRRQVPIGMRDVRVPDISREGDHRVIDVRAVPLSQLDAFADGRMAKIVNARRRVTAAGHPAELRAQPFKDPLHRRFAQSST